MLHIMIFLLLFYLYSFVPWHLKFLLKASNIIWATTRSWCFVLLAVNQATILVLIGLRDRPLSCTQSISYSWWPGTVTYHPTYVWGMKINMLSYPHIANHSDPGFIIFCISLALWSMLWSDPLNCRGFSWTLTGIGHDFEFSLFGPIAQYFYLWINVLVIEANKLFFILST